MHCTNAVIVGRGYFRSASQRERRKRAVAWTKSCASRQGASQHIRIDSTPTVQRSGLTGIVSASSSSAGGGQAASARRSLAHKVRVRGSEGLRALSVPHKPRAQPQTGGTGSAWAFIRKEMTAKSGASKAFLNFLSLSNGFFNAPLRVLPARQSPRNPNSSLHHTTFMSIGN